MLRARGMGKGREGWDVKWVEGIWRRIGSVRCEVLVGECERGGEEVKTIEEEVHMRGVVSEKTGVVIAEGHRDASAGG